MKIYLLKALWKHLSKRRKNQFKLLLILMILSSFIEVVSLGSVLPFLAVLTAPDELYQHSLMQPFINLLELDGPQSLFLPLTIIFVVIVICTGLIRLLLLYSMTKLSFATGADLSINIYRRTLNQEYSVHISRNSSEVLNSIIVKTNEVTAVIIQSLIFVSSFVLIISIMSALFMINIVMAASASIGFGFLYILVIFFTKSKLKNNSQIIADKSTSMIKTLQEGLGGIRDVLIDRSQDFYCKIYRNADLPFRRASGDNMFISGSPRYAMEALGISLIAILALLMTRQEGGINTIIPTLGALALGAQRLLPALQQAYSAYSIINGAQSSFKDVLKLLDQPLNEASNKNHTTLLNFKDEISLENLSFHYEVASNENNNLLSNEIFNNANLIIKKGERVGFIGPTGSGKSTLLDIVMGLLRPTSGIFRVDDQIISDENRWSWQMHIAHVPQNIFLADSTIKENIAFGIDNDLISDVEVKKAAEKAQIAELIESWKDGYQTMVGERGVKLSGGQRQRIGIARALYKKVDVLILDEATSALDSKTESLVMKEIEKFDKELTILIIAHRLTTLKGCSRIIEITNNKINDIGSYQNISK